MTNMNGMKAPRITDSSLRDGSHPMRHQYTREQVRAVAQALDAAGVPVIEVTHGDGLAGSSIQYGFSRTSEMHLISEACDVCQQAKIAVLLLPGIGTVKELKEHLTIQVGFHAHNNLGVAIGNSLAALEAGADQLDGCLRGLGAGAGNAPTELLAAVLEKMGLNPGLDVYKLMDAAEYVIAPMMPFQPIPNRDAISIGYAGVYSTFLLHARHAGERYGVDPRDILTELGRRQAVAGQEDWILDVALELARDGQVHPPLHRTQPEETIEDAIVEFEGLR